MKIIPIILGVLMIGLVNVHATEITDKENCKSYSLLVISSLIDLRYGKSLIETYYETTNGLPKEMRNPYWNLLKFAREIKLEVDIDKGLQISYDLLNKTCLASSK